MNTVLHLVMEAGNKLEALGKTVLDLTPHNTYLAQEDFQVKYFVKELVYVAFTIITYVFTVVIVITRLE